MRSTYDSLLQTQQAYYSDYRFADLFVHAKRAPESIASLIQKIPGVAEVQTRVVSEVTLNLPDLAEPAQGRIVSVDENNGSSLNKLYLVRGRTIKPNAADEIVISGAFADANGFQPGDKLEAIINGRWRRLDIVGVGLSPEYIYEIRPGDIFPDNRRYGIIWMGHRSLEAAFDMDGAFNDAAISLAPGASESDVIDRVDRVLTEYGGTGAYGREDQQSNRFISNELSQLEVQGTLLPVIFLGVTAFLLHLVLSRLVNTQREQIGLLKAFGYSNVSIGLHFLELASVAVVGGVILGLALGYWLGSEMTQLYTEYFHFPVLLFSVNLSLILFAFLITFGTTAIGALAAVKRAVELPPAEAMRPEPPADFRIGMLEKFGAERFSSTTRIIIRNLSRQPIKSSMSILGISLAVALLFTGFYFFDAVERIVEIEFHQVIRDDVNVTFHEPRPGRAQYELAELPGVGQVQGFRSVPARFRFGYRSRRVGIIGVEARGDLRRIIDTRFRVYTPPAEGIVLSNALAEILGVKKGDTLTIEVLEGSRPTRTIEIADTVDELMGLNAYMDIQALNRLMREDNVISGAYLSVDKPSVNELFTRLKQMPMIAGVALPGAMLTSFNETFGRTIWIFTMILVAFASVIVFGVVYNSARISLSERGRELASLRVLGFTQREIASILLGEQALLTLAAIPVGYVLGLILCMLMNNLVDTEMLRLPLVFSVRTFVVALLATIGAAVLSGVFVIWRLRGLDLIEVLKTRE
jgi:putative ABC transport system permease protein